MKFLFKISLPIYRTVLLQAIPLFLLGKLLIYAAGHNPHDAPGEYSLYVFIIITNIVLYLYSNARKQDNNVSLKLFACAVILVITCTLATFYELYDNPFILKCIQSEELVASILLALFAIIGIIVISGMIRERKSL
ncbi:MAG: hypothetical protein K2P88_07330 [Chitinophagaceae bacterium]|uniref:hypothetical protein n=1 Tax=unclassified Paraflavitalea TaxID=2798305 RepID=UPI003D345FE6|nr:hypothetical protein [Chitinophagaceae bacterium]